MLRDGAILDDGQYFHDGEYFMMGNTWTMGNNTSRWATLDDRQYLAMGCTAASSVAITDGR